jgi:hypothetical protein
MSALAEEFSLEESFWLSAVRIFAAILDYWFESLASLTHLRCHQAFLKF